jgi:ribonuclease R
VQAVLDAVAGKPEEELVSSMLLRAMRKATYEPVDAGHYGLGAGAYCHFTSPIRRYPDLVVHRSLKALMRGELGSGEQAQIQQQLPQICRSCSDQERVADSASRDSHDIKMAELYAGHIGESFSGVVSGVAGFGLFVTLDDTHAEGLLPIRALGDEWFDYDETRLTLKSESTGTVYRLGKRVAVCVSGVDIDRGRIDFTLAKGTRQGHN